MIVMSKPNMELICIFFKGDGINWEENAEHWGRLLTIIKPCANIGSGESLCTKPLTELMLRLFSCNLYIAPTPARHINIV